MIRRERKSGWICCSDGLVIIALHGIVFVLFWSDLNPQAPLKCGNSSYYTTLLASWRATSYSSLWSFMWECEETEEVNTSVCPIIILTTCCVFIFPTCLAVSSSPVVLWPNSSVLCATVWWVENEHGLKRTASLWDVSIDKWSVV